MKIQVDKSHYKFSNYLTKKRWISIWHQLDELISLRPSKVLEIGSGSGLFKAVANHFGVAVETVDIDPDLNPDYVASVLNLPFDDNSYDCVCAFQMLEHLPYDESLRGFSEMVRVSKQYILISLPDAKPLWSYKIHIPKFGTKVYHFPKPFFRQVSHRFNGEHYWEINKKGYSLKKIITDFQKTNVKIIKQYRVDEYSWHHFLLFEIRRNI